MRCESKRNASGVHSWELLAEHRGLYCRWCGCAWGSAVWATDAQGMVLRIHEMTGPHIQNCINLVERGGGTGLHRSLHAALYCELFARRGRMDHGEEALAAVENHKAHLGVPPVVRKNGVEFVAKPSDPPKAPGIDNFVVEFDRLKNHTQRFTALYKLVEAAARLADEGRGGSLIRERMLGEKPNDEATLTVDLSNDWD